MRTRGYAAALGVLLTVVVAGVQADVAVTGLFSDHMVLQRDAAVPVWGTAQPGEEVTVTVADRTAKTKTDGQGRWQVKLEPLPAGGPHEMTIKGQNTITLNDVLVGEVWVCSGQSNMAFPMERALKAEEEIAAANYPKIRLLDVPRRPADEPQTDVGKQWQICSPETVKDFTAVGYFFGRELYKTLNVPIGLIDSAVGGTPAEAWTPRAALKADPDYQPIFERWDQQFAQAEAAEQKAADAAKKKNAGNRPTGKGADKTASRLANLRMANQRPSVLYNGMIHPLIPYAIRGAIWYQGEGNAKRAYQYRKLFPTMIRQWRSAWGQGDFPFLFVQLASYQSSQTEPFKSAWAELREAQSMTLSLPNTAMAVTIDIGESKDIHPRNKQDVGKRLALGARALVSGAQRPYSGPVYESMSVEGNKIRGRFSHTDDGLAARGGGALKGFAVAGEDQQFVEAQAVIDGDAVVVHSDQVSRPVAVRYAWADDVPDASLVNGAGLPASPFRTDDWPGLTVNEK